MTLYPVYTVCKWVFLQMAAHRIHLTSEARSDYDIQKTLKDPARLLARWPVLSRSHLFFEVAKSVIPPSVPPPHGNTRIHSPIARCVCCRLRQRECQQRRATHRLSPPHPNLSSVGGGNVHLRRRSFRNLRELTPSVRPSIVAACLFVQR